MIEVQCPYCQKTAKSKDEDVGRKVKCPACTLSFTVPSPKPAVPTWPEDARRRSDEASSAEPVRRQRDHDTPPRPVYRYSFVLRVGAMLMMVIGVVAVVGGLGMETTVRVRGGDDVNNVGLLFDKQIRVLGGIAVVGLGLLMELLAEVRGIKPIYR